MTARRTLNRFTGFIGIVGSAIAVSAAIDSRRQPRARDLDILGIDPERFPKFKF